jgi:molybdopterin synthase catalytic subunit
MSVRVQTEDFDTGAELRALSEGRTDIGALASFVGLVRDMAGTASGSASVSGLRAMELEHYPGMTEKALSGIEAEARERWPLQGVTIIHRYGPLAPGDQIVLVATASAHRQAAFESAAFLMDFLKTRAPFWKREIGADGEGRWVDARESDDAAAARWEKG